MNTPRRDPIGIAVAAAMITTAALLLLPALLAGGWAWLLALPAAPLLILGVFGLAFSLTVAPRDDRGRLERGDS